jgi:hypothetical protein
MFEQPARDDLARDVFWTVQFVFDDDALTENFAYTVGLADRGLPELHIMAAPRQEFSDSPWVLSAQDCATQLNAFARLLIDGKLKVGRAFTNRYDGGATTVVWTPLYPTDRDDVEAYCTDPSAKVISIDGELQPAESFPLSDLPRDVEKHWRAVLADILASVAPNRRGLKGFRAPTLDSSFSCNQDYGPLTPLVLARAHAISQATPQTLAAFIRRTMDAERCFSAKAVAGTAHTHAKLVGRHFAALNADELAETLVRSIRGAKGDSFAWRSTLTVLGLEAHESCPKIHCGASDFLVHAVAGMLVAATVEDRLDGDTRLAAFGPWSAAQDLSGSPERLWWAPAHVIDTIRLQVERLSIADVVTLIDIWSIEYDRPLPTLLRGLAVTGSRAFPPARTILRDAIVTEFIDMSPAIDPAVTEFLCCASALLSERASFSADDVHGFCAPFRAMLPNLETVMNSPISEAA